MRSVFSRRPPRLLCWGSRRQWNAAALALLLAFGVFYALPPWWGGRPDVALPPGGHSIRLFRADLGRTVTLDVEEYVFGVVAAEMPAGFHLEALKAQAVAARTYAARAIRLGRGLPDHPEALVTSEPERDQAWIAPEALRRRWGWAVRRARWARVQEAVAATRGEIVTYEGAPILAAYHSDSGGRTEASENYWSEYVPYLRSVLDPFSSGSPYHQSEIRFTLPAVLRALGASQGARLEVLSHYSSGRVAAVRIGEKSLSGRQVREALGLRSNWFEVRVDGGGVLFSVRGNGHGVGLSQYGADGMARRGYTYPQILRYYYQGTSLQTW